MNELRDLHPQPSVEASLRRASSEHHVLLSDALQGLRRAGRQLGRYTLHPRPYFLNRKHQNVILKTLTLFYSA